jgi:hypothetical protein
VYFKQIDVTSAVDVMSTIDRLAAERVGKNKDPDDEIGGFIGGLDFDYDEEEDDYEMDGLQSLP